MKDCLHVQALIRIPGFRFICGAVCSLLVFLQDPAQSQNIEAGLSNKVFVILNDRDQPVLAASEYAGLYPPGSGLNLRNHQQNDGQFRYPEFLVLEHFLSIKRGDSAGLLALYDSASRQILHGRINIAEAKKAYQAFPDFELLSKAVFGDFVRLRYNLITAAGEGIPWILIARKTDTRYYLTEIMSIDHLFIDISSVNPFNFKREDFNSDDVPGLHGIYFTADGLRLIPVSAGTGPGTLGIYFNIHRYSGDTTVKDRSPEVETLFSMQKSLQDTSDAAYLQLWDQRSREKLTSAAFYRNRIMIQREFYKKVDRLIPLGYLKAGEEIILFYKSEKNGQQSGLQLIPMKFEKDSFRLTMKTANYYAWQILNNPDVMGQIEKYLTQ